MRENSTRTWRELPTYTGMTCQLAYQCSNRAGDNQSRSRILFKF